MAEAQEERTPSRTTEETQKDVEDVKETEEKPSKLKQLWKKIDLDKGTAIMMFKGSIPPTIGVAFYQADAVAAYFTTLGYLVPIISVLSLCIMPRAKYLQTLVLNVIGICIGSAVSLLGIWTGVQARLNTQGPIPAAYNSSQAAVCAIWLFANIWFVNVLRAKLPALQFPVIMYSIFTNVAFTYGPLFATIAQGESLIKQLLTGFLTAFGISTGVSLFIFPVSSRTVVFKESAGLLMLFRGTIKAQSAYLASLESSDMFSSQTPAEKGGPQKGGVEKKVRHKGGKVERKRLEPSSESKALKGSIEGLTGLFGKLYGDLGFGKKEIAWGKLTADDLDTLFEKFRAILIPLVGMSTITDIFERVAERRGWLEPEHIVHEDDESAFEHDIDAKVEEKRVWNEVMKQLHPSFEVASQAMDEGLLHAGLVLELLPKPKAKKDVSTDEDVEDKGGAIRPGQPGFAKYLEDKMMDLYKGRGETLRTWAREKGLSAEQFDSARAFPTDDTQPPSEDLQHEMEHRRDQQQLYLILYMEHLLFSTGMAVRKFVEWADKLEADGQMKRNRLITPGKHRLKKWIMSLGNEDSSSSDHTPDSRESGQQTVYLGQGFKIKKDPEHLPATSAWQRFGNGLRAIPHFLGSVESAFGFRVACATLTVGIVAFLKDTQNFFIEQRLVWAMIIIAIGMTVTTGQSMFGFFGRVAGTTLSMVFSIVIWYIVDQKIPGVIVFLWLFIMAEMYFFLKFPRFIPVWLVCIVTQVLIIGYELQVEKIGIEASTASGQPYYPIYLLAPYRLACVAGGSFVAFIWTIFPYPLTDRSWLRKDLGTTIFLLANYYSVVHSTVGARLHHREGDMNDPKSPGRQLQKMRLKIFNKIFLLLPSLRQHADWQKWELNVGGKFPRETYERIIMRLTHIMSYVSLMSYATQTWQEDLPIVDPSQRRRWLDELAALLDTVDPTSHAVTSVLTLLSASVTQGSALPPYMQMPEPYHLSRKLEKLDKGILDSRHVEEPGYSAYAVMQVTSSLVLDDLEKLVDDIKALVGETDFSFRVESSTESSREDLVGMDGKGKQD